MEACEKYQCQAIGFALTPNDPYFLLDYLGAWLGDNDWEEIAFLPYELDKFLQDGGFEPKSIVRNWKDRKWLATEGKKGFTKKVTLAGERTRCYVVTRRAFDKLTR